MCVLWLVFTRVPTNEPWTDIQLNLLSVVYVGVGHHAQYSNPWWTTRWQPHCLSEDRNYLQASSTNRLGYCWGGEIRWQPAGWNVAPLGAQTMPLIRSSQNQVVWHRSSPSHTVFASHLPFIILVRETPIPKDIAVSVGYSSIYPVLSWTLSQMSYMTKRNFVCSVYSFAADSNVPSFLPLKYFFTVFHYRTVTLTGVAFSWMTSQLCWFTLQGFGVKSYWRWIQQVC